MLVAYQLVVVSVLLMDQAYTMWCLSSRCCGFGHANHSLCAQRRARCGLALTLSTLRAKRDQDSTTVAGRLLPFDARVGGGGAAADDASEL